MESPIIIESEGIKIKPELMIVDILYHCIFDNKVFIFYKDQEELTHCYEVNKPDVVKEISDNPSNIEEILVRHSRESE